MNWQQGSTERPDIPIFDSLHLNEPIKNQKIGNRQSRYLVYKGMHSDFLHRLLAAIAFVTFNTSLVFGSNLPDGFVERQVATGLIGATAMAVAPDGRVFVCQQTGELRVIKNGALLAEPFVTVETDPTGERGLLGIAFDPSFAQNGFIYLYYTALVTPRHNRVTRFTAAGDKALPGSEALIFQLDDLGSATIHNGGAMHFGSDGKLFISVGENGTPLNAQSLANVFGKVLRINSDGSIPSDNPFVGVTSGTARAIWALGLRNPFTFDIQPTSGRIFINDVGQADWEEINDGIAGSNYGWPQSEGPTTNPNERAPLFSYRNGIGAETGCAISGGAFYNPLTVQFPSSFVGKYFFADFCSGWIRVFDPQTNSVQPFVSGLSLPVDLKTSSDGSLYYLSRGNDSLFQIIFTGTSLPVITSPPSSQTVSVGEPATFTVTASGGQPLSYQWQKNGQSIIGATSANLTISSVTLADNGAQITVVVSNAFGTVVSDPATLTVNQNQPPVGMILTPQNRSFYQAGDVITYSGTASDTEDGELAAARFTWQVDFHHHTHVHPFLPPTTGSRTGSFAIPTIGETATDVFYRIRLKVVDSGGRTHESFCDLLPRLSVITMATQPSGLQIAVDGQRMASPSSFTTVAGITRNISTEQVQSLAGVRYEFVGWSDGGARSHDIASPLGEHTLTATFAIVPDANGNSIQVTSSSYSGSEGGHVDVVVTRSGDLSTPSSVDYATVDGTATHRSDYLAVRGTLFFAAGESMKIVRLLLTDGATVEGNESFSISLSNVSGQFALGTPSVASISVTDDDTNPPTENPIDSAGFFVRQHYQDFLNREPDEAGLAFWTSQITACGNDGACVELKRQWVSAAFFFSIESQETSFFVYRLNVASFDRFP
ncbi:MAG TPA: PQQ-dependent sugar dehydrogenase, partial [Pyrinomonadaceae bacterium]